MGKNGIEVIVFNGKKWLNENRIEDQLKHSNLVAVTRHYSPELRKQRQELQDWGKDFAMQIIMNCRTTPANNTATQQPNVLGFRIDAYIPKYKLATEVGGQRHNDRDIDYEIEIY